MIQPRSRRAFTLMEVLLAVALVAALVSSMLAFLVDVSASRTRAQAAAASRRAADILMDRVESDLMTCIVGNADVAGIDGSSTSLQILSRGVAAPLALRDSPGRTLGDLQRAICSFDPDEHSLSAWRGPIDAHSAPVLMGATLAQVRFRYHDGVRWMDSFNSAIERRLPVAVEVAVWVHDPESQREVEQASAGSGDARVPLDDDVPASDPFDSMLEGGEDDDEPSSMLDRTLPDRLRVITIPDAREGETLSSSEAAS